MDANIKVFFCNFDSTQNLVFIFQSMYTLMAKTEEVTVVMKAVESYFARM